MCVKRSNLSRNAKKFVSKICHPPDPDHTLKSLVEFWYYTIIRVMSVGGRHNQGTTWYDMAMYIDIDPMYQSVMILTDIL